MLKLNISNGEASLRFDKKIIMLMITSDTRRFRVVAVSLWRALLDTC